MKKQRIVISLLAICCLASCGGNGGGNGGNTDKSKLVINDFGTAKIEAEDFDVSNWEADESYDGEKIIEAREASGGKYLAASTNASSVEAKFKFELKKFSKVVISAAYAQMEADINTAIDMSKGYHISIETVSPLSFAEGRSSLRTRESHKQWEVMAYEPQDLYPATYNVTISVKEDATKLPSIDYFQFKTTDASSGNIDPSNITEADIPDNDMRNLQQYKYILDDDPTSYKTYATGGDLSAPRGMKLKFEDVGAASKYYVQIAESEADLASAAVRESTNNYYMFQNAKLATKYYYRAATSEAGLASAAVKNITSTSVAPRVVSVPDVLNFRDIGGWDSSLVADGKIKQGLYFRCAQLNAAGGSTTSKLDSAGKGLAAIKELGIKQDIDMRDSPSSTSPANTTAWPVSMVQAAVMSGSEPVRWEGGTYRNVEIAPTYVKIFKALAECDSKPAMLHCTYGADRTGIVTFFLEALLGMSIEDMTRDYLWTQFTQGRTVKYFESDAEFPKWISKTNACEGETFADKMENHIVSFAPASEQTEFRATLEHIREIFVPGYVAK